MEHSPRCRRYRLKIRLLAARHLAAPTLFILLGLSTGCARNYVQKAISRITLERVEGLEVADFDSTGIVLDLRLAYRNPTALHATMDRFTYDLEFDGLPFGSGSYDRPFSLPADSTFVITLPVRSRYSALAPALIAAIAEDSVAYGVDAKMYVSGWPEPLAVHLEGRLPLARNLKDAISGKIDRVGVEIARFDISTSDDGTVRLAMDLQIHNPLPIKVELNRAEYKLFAGEQPVGQGYVRDMRLIDHGAGVLVRTYQDLSPVALTTAMVRSLGKAPFSARGSLLLEVLGTRLDIAFETPGAPLSVEQLQKLTGQTR